MQSGNLFAANHKSAFSSNASIAETYNVFYFFVGFVPFSVQSWKAVQTSYEISLLLVNSKKNHHPNFPLEESSS